MNSKKYFNIYNNKKYILTFIIYANKIDFFFKKEKR